MTTFPDSEFSKASAAHCEIESDLCREGVDREVVMLQASSEEAVRRTHRRYFKSAEEIAEDIRQAVQPRKG